MPGGRIVIVGGGIAGLYCARTLANGGYSIEVLESTGRFGGRCETADFEPGPDNGPLPFKAEFGPMRFELDIQPLLSDLLSTYDIGTSEFSQPTSGSMPIHYPLDPAEYGPSGQPPSPLQLLKFGLFRMLGWSPSFADVVRQGETYAEVQLPDVEEESLNALSDHDGSFDELRRTAELPGYGQLHKLGFWNTLYTTLSPMAVASILHFGTFYHLMPDNPNAAEWAIFWLRVFQPGGARLTTIPAGVEQLTQRLAAELTEHPSVELKLNHRATAIRSDGRGKFEVDLAGDRPSSHGDHVILALPKQPLQALDAAFPKRIRADLDSVIAFPLLKVFCVTESPPWWTSPRKPQESAWVAPTREIHYLPLGELKDNTLILLYTDRPASAYWQPYLKDPEFHREAESNRNPKLKEALRRVLFELHWAWALERIRMPGGRAKPWFVQELDGRRVLNALNEVAEVLQVEEDDPAYAELARQRPALVSGPAMVLFQARGFGTGSFRPLATTGFETGPATVRRRVSCLEAWREVMGDSAAAGWIRA